MGFPNVPRIVPRMAIRHGGNVVMLIQLVRAMNLINGLIGNIAVTMMNKEEFWDSLTVEHPHLKMHEGWVGAAGNCSVCGNGIRIHGRRFYKLAAGTKLHLTDLSLTTGQMYLFCKAECVMGANVGWKIHYYTGSKR